MSGEKPGCALCEVEAPKRYCRNEKGGKGPKNCPSLRHGDLRKKALEELKKPEIFEFARQSAIQEGEGYTDRHKGEALARPCKPRIQEIIEFAHKMKYQRLGLIFCEGLHYEARIVQKIFEDNGFEVVSVICKTGRVSKKELELSQEEQVDIMVGYESMCNPILQALVANHHQVQLNVLLGLCVGHDALFIKYAEAFTTVLAAKDRMLAHNPLAAVYHYNSYYRYLKEPV